MVIDEGSVGDVPDVPDVSARWYAAVVGAVADLPAPGTTLIELLPILLLLVSVVLAASAWWSARRAEATVMATALAVPTMASASYVVSESVKAIMQIDRPCHLVAGVTTLEPCPPLGDWSFPSNHATVAGALAVGLCWIGARFGGPAVFVALAEAASRVLVGAHFPHDVAVGLALGGTAAVTVPLVALALRPVVVALRSSRVRWVVAEQAPAAAPTMPMSLRR